MISPVPRTNLHPLYGLRSSDGVCKHWGELKRYSQLAEKGSEERIRVEFRVIVEDEVRADYRAAYTFLYARGSSFCLLLSLSLSIPPPAKLQRRAVFLARARRQRVVGAADARNRRWNYTSKLRVLAYLEFCWLQDIKCNCEVALEEAHCKPFAEVLIGSSWNPTIGRFESGLQSPAETHYDILTRVPQFLPLLAFFPTREDC